MAIEIHNIVITSIVDKISFNPLSNLSKILQTMNREI